MIFKNESIKYYKIRKRDESHVILAEYMKMKKMK